MVSDVLESSGTLITSENRDANLMRHGDMPFEIGKRGDGVPGFMLKPYSSMARFRLQAIPGDPGSVELDTEVSLSGHVQASSYIKQTDMSFRNSARVKLGQAALLLGNPGEKLEVLVEKLN